MTIPTVWAPDTIIGMTAIAELRLPDMTPLQTGSRKADGIGFAVVGGVRPNTVAHNLVAPLIEQFHV